ncbi:hypothetical protein C6P46_002937 [Rhodotorula mucilaginosa]|uniref:Methyltransferase-like protein n=1 Tax=Rhodotorula mucilaginosa TaxID=5537 RepID=A0A9P7B6U6_RHOMI|nr:hypothetical protein C6P46_002937 [Rhodotorula mucilaginosa]
MESRTDQSSLASTSTSVPPQSETPIASSSTDSKPTRTSKAKKPRIVLQGTPDEILDRNAARSASPAFVEKLVARAGTHWNKFYSNHAKNPATNQFFKDRHWTDREWPQLAQLAEPVDPKGKGKAVLEVGCGTGAFIYPLLERYPQARYVAFDFAKKAVELTKTHPLYTPSSCHIFQHDLTLPLSSLSDKLASPPPEFGDPILPGSFDIVSCVFVLSALPPHKQAEAVKSLISLLAPGGWLLFRDYALRDAAQLRFHSLPSASYATEPSLLSPRTRPPPPASCTPASDSVPNPAAPTGGNDTPLSTLTTTTTTTPATATPATAPTTTAPSPIDANLPFYRRGDNTLTYFFTPSEVTSFVDSALEDLRQRDDEEGGIELEGSVEVVEREMENRKEG